MRTRFFEHAVTHARDEPTHDLGATDVFFGIGRLKTNAMRKPTATRALDLVLLLAIVSGPATVAGASDTR